MASFFCVTINLDEEERKLHMIDLALFDIDGTFRDEACGIPPSAVLAVERLKERGCLTGICTGRSLGTIPDEVMALNLDCLIAGGGSFIRYRDRILKDYCFDSETVIGIRKELEHITSAAYTFETEDQVFMNRTAASILSDRNKKKWGILSPKEEKRMEQQEKIQYEANMEYFEPLRERVHKICLWLPESEYSFIRRITGRAEIYPAQEDIWEEGWFYEELIRAGCDKGSAVMQLCTYLKIPPSRTISFGDGKNDIDMLKATGLAVAMKNSHKALLPYADTICEAAAEDGIYNELKRRRMI